MPSNANTKFLEAVLSDASEIVDAHLKLRTGRAGRQYGLGALNRAVVVMCISAWEAYVEEVVKEVVEKLRPAAGTSVGTWPSWKASIYSQIGRFNNPNTQHTKELIRDATGLSDITSCWIWQHTMPADAARRLDEAIRFRHEVAHGTAPRPTIHNVYAAQLPELFRKLGLKTDLAISNHLQISYSINTGW